MLAKRIIPTILVRGKTAYKGERFQSTRSIGSALAIAQVHARRGVDELMILDVSATAEGRGPDLDLVRELSQGCYIPITIGGGVRTLQHIDDLLRAGADKVAICSALIDCQNIAEQAADRFGKQAIVAVIEYLDVEGMPCVTWHSRNRTLTINSPDSFERVTPVSFALNWPAKHAGEILLSSVDRDGMLCGYDLDLIFEVSAAVDIPVIASGGCGTYQHMLEAFKAGADACASGAMFAFTDAVPRGAAKYLLANGVNVRVP